MKRIFRGGAQKQGDRIDKPGRKTGKRGSSVPTALWGSAQQPSGALAEPSAMLEASTNFEDEAESLNNAPSSSMGHSGHSRSQPSAASSEERPAPAERRTKRTESSASSSERPSYRVYDKAAPAPAPIASTRREQEPPATLEDDDEDSDDDEINESLHSPSVMPRRQANSGMGGDIMNSITKAKHIEQSAGTNRLNRILSKTQGTTGNTSNISSSIGSSGMSGNNNVVPVRESDGPGGRSHSPLLGFSTTHHMQPASMHSTNNNSSSGFQPLSPSGGPGPRRTPAMPREKVSDPRNLLQVGAFVSRVVLPPLKVDSRSIGGSMLDGYPETMQQETLLTFMCQAFEFTGNETVSLSALQYPADYAKHKRSLGLFGGAKGRNKIRYVLIARSTNKSLLNKPAATPNQQILSNKPDDDSEREDYDAMFADEDDDELSKDMSLNQSDEGSQRDAEESANPVIKSPSSGIIDVSTMPEEEVSSFPVLVCMTLHGDGSAPDIRKLVSLDQLTTVQDLHTKVVQLAFTNGDTVRLDFGDGDEEKAVEGSLDKERFIWSLLQTHAILCTTVVERNAMNLQAGKDRMYLPPLNVRNLDRAELQYVATVNGFLRDSEALCALLDRQRTYYEGGEGGLRLRSSGSASAEDEKVEMEEMDGMAYDLMMGNFATRVALFQSEDERKDAEEILNSRDEWTTNPLDKEEAAAVSVAERLGLVLQGRMRDLEAETCRRLIAWEDEKHLSSTGKGKLHSNSDERDSVDALALASLFKTLESLDTELKSMEDWLQDRAGAIKPLTDDCADIEEENRQLEQQWKSYDMLGAEMKRLLQGLEISEEMDKVLKNPASALVYDDEGLVDVEESEKGVEQIYEAGKSLQEAMEYPKRSGGMHLNAVSERAELLTQTANGFCTALAQIIVTVMEQFKTEVVAGSDYGKVSKSDTHSMIAKKIRDTQRKFQQALLGYIKLIEILAALSPDMLPALRDAYSEMVAESILMKKRMKGYFQALPGKNAAYINRAGKDLRDYIPFDDTVERETVNAPDVRNTLSELLPVVAREAYFTSALFGSTRKESDGREKKRNFENTKKAVDNSTQHFRYYIYRTCGIMAQDHMEGKSVADATVKGDPLLNLVASIYLNESMDYYVDREKKGGDHSLSLAYVRASILDLRKKADKQWVIWVDKQIEWIKSNDGVPLTGKRAGIFPSFARFPCYLDHVLQCCGEGREENYEPGINGIKVLTYYLQKMGTALLESLKDCATRETTDKQYASNVMQMENTYFFTQGIKQRGKVVETLFAKQVAKANAICKESTDAYLGWMIKREFTVLHELFSKASKMRKDHGDREVLKQIPKAQFVRTLTKEANRELLKEKIGVVYSRMEKHLSEDGGLLPVAWKALVKVLYEWFGRWEKLSTAVYQHKLNPSAVDVVRIAKAAGGAAKPKPQATGGEFGFKSILALGGKAAA